MRRGVEGVKFVGGRAYSQGMDVIQRAVEARMKADHAVIETAVEAALQGGTCGVLVIRDRPSGAVLIAQPDSTVPYGYIYESN